MREKTYRLALGGIMCSVAIASMFLGSVIPFATFSAPALASLCVLFIAAEFGKGFALLTYAAIALLGFLIAPDKEIALLFTFFFGYYPIIKGVFEQRLKKPLAYGAKFAVFNVAIIGLYYIVTRIFVIAAVRDEFATLSALMLVFLLIVGNFTFFVFDVALTRLISIYFYRWRTKFLRR